MTQKSKLISFIIEQEVVIKYDRAGWLQYGVERIYWMIAKGFACYRAFRRV